MQWFCKYAHESKLCQEWAKGANVELGPFHTNLMAVDGPDIVARAYKWAGANFPGFFEDKALRGLGDSRKRRPPALVGATQSLSPPPASWVRISEPASQLGSSRDSPISF